MLKQDNVCSGILQFLVTLLSFGHQVFGYIFEYELHDQYHLTKVTCLNGAMNTFQYCNKGSHSQFLVNTIINELR